MAKTAVVPLEYQPLLDMPPVPPEQLLGQACLSDGVTVNTWHKTWVDQARANKERFGSFTDMGIGNLWNKYRYKPVIIAGSGPSLKENAAQLKDRGEIPLISCLHNFHYLEDLEAHPEFYVSADAGPVTIEEVSEGGARSPEEYWALTQDRTLLAFVSTHPELLKKWRGQIYFFSTTMPDPALSADMKAIEDFSHVLSCGSTVFGACLYIAKAYMGAGAVIFVGADFCYSLDHKMFHPWTSKYDIPPQYPQRLVDIYGLPRLSTAAYINFKAWFEYVGLKVPGVWINASEGGCLGAYLGGNLSCFKYMDLAQALEMYQMNERIKLSVLSPSGGPKYLLF